MAETKTPPKQDAPDRDWVPERFRSERKCPACNRTLTEYIDEKSRGVMCTGCHTRWPEIRINPDGRYGGRIDGDQARRR